MVNGAHILLTLIVVTIATVSISCGSGDMGNTVVGATSPLVIDPGLEERLAASPADEKVPVIVRFKDIAQIMTAERVSKGIAGMQVVRSLEGHALQMQAPFIEFLKGRGAENITPLWVINAIAFEADASLIRELAKQEGVLKIREDTVFTAAQPLAAGGTADEWNLYAVRAPELWAAGFSGQGIVVANMDTGVDAAHPDLATNWRGGTNSWYDPYGEHATPYDVVGHGTQAMGLAVGGNASGVSIGVAPGASWIAVKIFNDARTSQISKIHQGFQWLLNPDGDPSTDDTPDIVSNSWGMNQYIDDCVPEFEQDIAALRAAGIAVVASAGNDGPAANSSLSPANSAGVLSVGAVDDMFEVPLFSSRGPSACDGSIYPKISAPGANILTTDLTFNGTFPSSYTFVSGTSFASSHVAGTLALIKSAMPAISAADAVSALETSALDINVSGPDNASGQGMVDGMAAYDLLMGSTICNDADADGYFSEGGCGSARDCNDADAAINPAAQEIVLNSIDEDCNGYDLTIQGKVGFAWRLGLLRAWATSELGRHAYLELQGYGPMRWNESRNRFELEIQIVGDRPLSVVVAGVEGEISVSVARTREGWSVPFAPLGLSVGTPAAGRVTLLWTDASANEAGFVVERSLLPSGPFTIIGQAVRDGLTYQDATARTGLTYYYQVRAFNSSGYSAPSNIVSIMAN